MALPVYLVHYDAPDWVRSAAASICRSDVDVALTIIDNGSKPLEGVDGAAIIRPGFNAGYAGGANLALRDWLAGDGEWCVVGAHDLHVEPNTFRRMLESTQDGFGILGPGTELRPDGTGYFSGSLLGAHGDLEERTAMSGTCLMLRRPCIREIGLFDEQFGSYGEDHELCNRARANGWKVGRVRNAAATGLGSSSERRGRLRERAVVMVALKSHGRGRAARVMMRQLRALLKSLVLGCLPTDRGAQRRRRARDLFFGLRHGVPMLWKPMLPPPTA